MESLTNILLPQEGTDASSVGESLRVPARCPTESGGGNQRSCGSPAKGVDMVPAKGGETTTATNSDSDYSFRSVGSNGPARSGAGLPSRDSKGRFLRKDKGPSQGQSDGNRFAALPVDDEATTPEVGLLSSDGKKKKKKNKRPTPSSFASGRIYSDAESEGLALTKITTARRGKSRGTTAGPSRDKFLKPAPVQPTRTDMSTDNESDFGSLIDEDMCALNAQELRARGGEGVADILEVARRSGNLKGGFIARLKKSAMSLREVVDTLASRTESNETRQLRVELNRVKMDNEALRVEVKSLRRGFNEAKAEAAAATVAAANATASVAGPLSTLSGVDIVEQLRPLLTSLIDTRMAELEKKLLQAPSARQRMREGSVSTAPPPASKHSETAGPSTTAREETWATVVKKGKGKGKGKSSTPASTPAPAVKPSVTAGPTANSTERPAAKEAGKQTAKPSAKRKLKAPRTAAVILSLQPEAAEKGQTYSSVLQAAREKINIEELGIDRIRFRQTATGARMWEIPGSDRVAKADRLAESLREALSGVASIVRPVKTADVRISGLDETATTEGVAAAVAKAAGCDVALVRAGGIRSGFAGTGSVLVSCPLSAAKVLTEKGRILIGWSSARVVALEARPMRCYRCMGLGHTRPQCPASVDRGELCFRCGRAGHKAAACEEATLRCAVCAESGRPSGHTMGGRSCKPAMQKGKIAGTRATPAVSSKTAEVVPLPADVEVVMSD